MPMRQKQCPNLTSVVMSTHGCIGDSSAVACLTFKLQRSRLRYRCLQTQLHVQTQSHVLTQSHHQLLVALPLSLSLQRSLLESSLDVQVTA
jgi:hypothetical protein